VLHGPASQDPDPGITTRSVLRFRGGLVVKAHRLVYHSTLGLRVIKKKKKTPSLESRPEAYCGCRVYGLWFRAKRRKATYFP